MKKALLSPLLPALLLLGGCGDTPEQALAKAQKEYAAHDYSAARIHLAAALSGRPGDKNILLLQARTLLALGDGDGAATAIAQLGGNQPVQGELAELAAEAALLRGKPDVALEYLANAQSVEADRLRAMVAVQKNDQSGAARFFEKGLAAGGNPRLFADYARLKLMSGDPGGAQDLAARALRQSPDGIDSLLVSGELAVRRGDLGAALGHYSRAEKLYPVSIAAIIGKASVLGELGRTDEMKPLVERAAAAAPDNPGIGFLRVKMAQQRKDWSGIKAIVQPLEAKLGALDPIRQIYGEALVRLNESEQAIAQLQPIVRAMPGNRDALRLLAEAQLINGDVRAALTTIRPLADSVLARKDDLEVAARIAKAAGDPMAERYAARSFRPLPQTLGHDLVDGDAAMRAGNWAGAAAAYARILEVTDGRNVVVLNNMAYAQLMLGNAKQAMEFAARAVRLAPGNPSVLDTAGWATFKSGSRRPEALQLLRKAAQLAPQNATIRAHLAEAERAPV